MKSSNRRKGGEWRWKWGWCEWRKMTRLLTIQLTLSRYVRGRAFIGNNASWGQSLFNCVWLTVITSDCCVGSCAQMVVLDCRCCFEHLTGCKWRHARYMRCRLQRYCLHTFPISDGKGGLDSITESTGYGDTFFAIYALTQR